MGCFCIFLLCRTIYVFSGFAGSSTTIAPDQGRTGGEPTTAGCHATTTQSLFLILVYNIWYTWYESYLQSIINVHIYIIFILYIFLAFPVNVWSWQLLAERTEPLPGITWMSVATVKVSDSASTGIHHEMVRWETVDQAIFNALTLVVCCRSWMIFVNMPWY